MKNMKIKLGYKSDEEYFAESEQGIRVDIDMLDPANKKAMSPMQLLLSGLISCAAVDIVAMVKKRRRTLIDFSGEVAGVRQDETPKKFTHIHIKYTFTSPDLTEEEAERFVSLGVSKYCSVSGSLNDSIEMEHSFEIIRPATA